ncbi:MAG TPA: glycosyltransferase family 2 protein [Solirubrobacteraceae bacterium]|jgi:GT2 family glycosyltransferase|nr:glycosyltransferase family 2 protein [Solirubrobacteraceae bacterium]
MDRPAISVLVVAYRQREALAEALESCLAAAANVADDVELIVIDNGELASFVRDGFPSARVIEPAANLGFAGGVQRGLADARGEWIALVNDDARLDSQALAKLLDTGRREQRTGSVAAQIRFASDPGRINSAGISVDSLGVASERLAGRPASEADGASEVFGASGCVALYRRTMLDEVGGLDERFFAYLEDVDLAWRARAAGWIAVYEPLAIAYHHGSASTGEGSQMKYFLVGRNRVRLLARNATTGQLLRSLAGILLYDLVYVIYAALADRTLAPLRGRLAGLREWRAFRREGQQQRRAIALSPASKGWRSALRMRRAYRELGARGAGEL